MPVIPVFLPHAQNVDQQLPRRGTLLPYVVLMLFATGTRLPPEVVAHIARLCCARQGGWDKRSRGICSLTCRYWSQLARRDLLESITLKCAADISQLLQYLDAPTRLIPSLRDCIWGLHLVDCQLSPKPTPWLHDLIRLKSKLRPDVDVRITFTVDSSQPASASTEAALRTARVLPFTTLPRTLPPSVLRVAVPHSSQHPAAISRVSFALPFALNCSRHHIRASDLHGPIYAGHANSSAQTVSPQCQRQIGVRLRIYSRTWTTSAVISHSPTPSWRHKGVHPLTSTLCRL